MLPTTQHPLNSPVFAPQLAYLAVEKQPADAAEAQRLEQLRQLRSATRIDPLVESIRIAGAVAA